VTYDPNGPHGGASNPYGPQAPPAQPGGYPPVPPPKKSKAGVIIGTIVAVVVVTVAVCGLGGWALSDSSDSSANPSPGTSDSPSGPATTDSRTLVQPAGAPYSFRMPDGFQPVATPKSRGTGPSPTFTSAAATTRTETNDLLIVDAYALAYDADAVSPTELATKFDGLIKQLGQDPSTRKNVTYDGHKGFWYQFDLPTSKDYSYFLFQGTNEIQVRCQWVDQETQIKKGCEDLLNSLQI
jgi:hypothetical protein